MELLPTVQYFLDKIWVTEIVLEKNDRNSEMSSENKKTLNIK